MKVAVLSDIHSMYYMFDAVVNKLVEENIDYFLFLGDYVSDGFENNEVLEKIKWLESIGKTVVSVLGNRDLSILNYNGVSWENEPSLGNLLYAYKDVNEDNFNYLKSMNTTEKIILNDKNIYLSHHNILENNDPFYPHSENYIKCINEKYKNSLFLTGHIHTQFNFKNSDNQFINPGAFGISRDIANGIAYCVLEIDKDIKCDMRVESFDINEVAKHYINSRYYELNPEWTVLLLNSYVNQKGYFVPFINYYRENPQLAYHNAFIKFANDNKLDYFTRIK